MANNNQQSKLGKALSRLFSSNVVVRNVGDKQLKVVDTSRIQSVASKYLKNRYQGVHMSAGTSAQKGYGDTASFMGNRIGLFRDYEAMDQDAIVSAALDIYADEACTENEYGDIISVEAEDGEVKEILNNLFYDILNIDFNLRPWVRNLVKYGDCFLKLDISEEYGVINAQSLSPYELSRSEGDNPENPYEVTFDYDVGSRGGGKFEFWEVAHFRLLSDSNYLPYGKSVLEGARKTWKQLVLMEDAMLIHRIMRAPEKRVFRIDVGNIEPEAVDTFMQQIISEVKKTPLIDPKTGEYNLKFNLMNMIEDFYLPVRGGDSGTQIDTLSGMQYQAMEDIEYLRNKMMTALRIPNAFLGYERDLEGKATLAQQSIKFANQISYVQKVMVSELTKIAIIHLYSIGIRDKRLTDFKLSLTNPSTVLEQEYIDLLSRKFDLARTVIDMPIFSTEWVYQKIFNMSGSEIESQRRNVVKDWQRQFRREQIEREGNDPVKTGQSFGTPADLALSGSADLKPLSLDIDEKEAESAEISQNVKNNINNSNDRLGRSGINRTNLRTTKGDYTHTYTKGSPLALDNISPKQKDILAESLSDLNEEMIDHPNHNENVPDYDDDVIDESSYMSESILDLGKKFGL